MQTITKTDERLIAMFTENTGKSFLDSGDAYGRHWERNQNRTPEEWLNRHSAIVETDYGLNVEIDLFKWLRDRVELTPTAELLQQQWEEWVKADPERDVFSCASMEDWANEITNSHEGEPSLGNSYNWENLLNQVIQYVPFTWNETHFVLLQIHGGCDVRGGYTAPQLFEVESVFTFYDMTNADVYCSNSACEWWMNYSIGGDTYDSSEKYYGYEDLKELKACPECGSELKAETPIPNQW